MDKEVIRNLIKWMEIRHEIELNRVRVGSYQKTRLGSATKYWDGRMNISISTYNTNTGTSWDDIRKIQILGTIVHEFAHLVLYKDGLSYHGHGNSWINKFHEMLANDWQELVSVYNLLAVDNLSNDWEFMIEKYDSQYFSKSLLLSFIKIKLDYRKIITDVLAVEDDIASAIKDFLSLGLSFINGSLSVVTPDNDEIRLSVANNRITQE